MLRKPCSALISLAFVFCVFDLMGAASCSCLLLLPPAPIRSFPLAFAKTNEPDRSSHQRHAP